MDYRPLGRSGMSVSAAGLGTWAIGGGVSWGGPTDDAESIRAIQASLDAGLTLIDTAPVYGFGRSEEIVGRAIRGRREQVFVATKGGLWWRDRRGSSFRAYDGKRLFRSLRPDTLRIEVEDSLRRLDVDCIDLYQTHWPAMDPERTPIAETMGLLAQLRREGKIRAIGVSNVSAAEFRECLACGEVDAIQPRYNLLWRDVEQEIVPICLERRVALLAYMPLEQGLLTGRVGSERTFPRGEVRSDAAWNPWFTPANRPRVLELLAGWQDLATRHGCTLAQLAIAWTLAQPGVTTALCGARHAWQAVENARAADLRIDRVDLQRMRADAESLGGPLPESAV